MRYDIEIQQMKQFMAVARAGNFTKAAKDLNLSQSALSRSIQKLEDEIGQPLFERRPREVVLTDLGEVFRERVREILKLTEDTFSFLSEAGHKGRIRLGAIPTIAPYFLPTILQSFSQENPEVSVLVQEDTTENLLLRCNRGEIDLAILALPVSVKYLETEPLFDEELFVVVPTGHELTTRSKITAEAIEDYPFVTLTEAHCLSDNIASYCRQESVQPVSVERISQLTTVQELVALGHGISMVPEMAKCLDACDRRAYLSFDGRAPTRTVGMLWNPYRYQSKWVENLREHLRHSTRKPETVT